MAFLVGRRADASQLYVLMTLCVLDSQGGVEGAVHRAAALLEQPALTYAVAASHRPVLLHLVGHLVQQRRAGGGSGSAGCVPADADAAVALVRVLDVAPHALGCAA